MCAKGAVSPRCLWCANGWRVIIRRPSRCWIYRYCMRSKMTNSHLITPELIAQLVDLSRRAGAAIMAIYTNKDSYHIEHKSDDSPLTAADLAAHRVISAELPGLLPLPIISEEGAIAEFTERQLWDSYWLVDPLDGTKEFIAGNGQFTVNIALIQNGRTRLGVVHVPVRDITYL